MDEQNQNQEQDELAMEQETGLEKGAKDAGKVVINQGTNLVKGKLKAVLPYLLAIAKVVGIFAIILTIVIIVIMLVKGLVDIVGNVTNWITDKVSGIMSIFTIGDNGISMLDEDDIMKNMEEQLKNLRI